MNAKPVFTTTINCYHDTKESTRQHPTYSAAIQFARRWSRKVDADVESVDIRVGGHLARTYYRGYLVQAVGGY